jgi:hypothetical protein
MIIGHLSTTISLFYQSLFVLAATSSNMKQSLNVYKCFFFTGCFFTVGHSSVMSVNVNVNVNDNSRFVRCFVGAFVRVCCGMRNIVCEVKVSHSIFRQSQNTITIKLNIIAGCAEHIASSRLPLGGIV